MVYILKLQTSNEILPVNNILRTNSDSNAETNSTIGEDSIESQKNDHVGNSSLRLARSEENCGSDRVILNKIVKQ